jgi:hypothetical protein
MIKETQQIKTRYSNGKVISQTVIHTREVYACVPSLVDNIQVEWKRYSGKRKKHKGLVFSLKFV